MTRPVRLAPAVADDIQAQLDQAAASLFWRFDLIIGAMEQKPRLGRSMSVDEVAGQLGWSEADKAEHLRSLDDRPVPDLEEAKARIAARTR